MIAIDEIIRSKRRTIGLEITADARLVIRAPRQATKKQISLALSEKSGWIEEKLAQARSRREKHPPKRCEAGEIYEFLGLPLTLVIGENAAAVGVRGQNLVVPSLPPDKLRALLVKWYKEQALLVLRERTEHFAAVSGTAFRSLRITNALSRWGSCTGDKICYSWRLVLAPVKMIDYVVAHEISHIRHPDHSKAFWAAVAALLPDFEARKKWFRDNAALLRPDFFAE